MDAEWVSVSDEIPEGFDCYFLKCRDGYCHGWHNKNDGWCSNGRVMDREVLAWLRLTDKKEIKS